MKTVSIIKTIVMSGAFALIITSCKKEQLTKDSTTNPAIIAAIEGMRSSYNIAKTYNDSLNYWYNMDSTHYIAMMHYCDSLYHNNNSIMMNNYNIMSSGGTMMNGGSTNGGMMGGGTANGGTMNGGMMGANNTILNCTINGNNSTIMINSLHLQHIHHPNN